MPAEITDGLPPLPLGTGLGARYDWDAWLIAGKKWTFFQETDFPGVNMTYFRNQLRAKARARGLRVVTRKLGEHSVNAWIYKGGNK